MAWLPDSEDFLNIYDYTFWHNLRTWQTDTQTPHDDISVARQKSQKWTPRTRRKRLARSQLRVYGAEYWRLVVYIRATRFSWTTTRVSIDRTQCAVSQGIDLSSSSAVVQRRAVAIGLVTVQINRPTESPARANRRRRVSESSFASR